MTDILIVEDEAAIADALGVALRREGFVVRHAGLAAEARRAFEASAPGLMIPDIGLPDGNGFGLTPSRPGNRVGVSLAHCIESPPANVMSGSAGQDRSEAPPHPKPGTGRSA